MPGIIRCRKQSVLKKLGANVVAAAEGCEGAARFQEFQGAQMNLFVPTQCVGHRGTIARKRRRIKDDQVKARNDALVRFDGGVRLEPVKDIDGLKGALVRESVFLRITGGGGNRIRTLIQQVNVRCTGPGGVQTEAAEETKAIKHLAVFGKPGYGLIICLLIEVHSGLMASHEVGLKLNAIQQHRNGPGNFPGQYAIGFRQAFKLARGHIAALRDGTGGKDFLQGGHNVCFASVHAECGDLHDQDILIFVHDQAAQKVTFGIDHPEGGGVRQMALPHGERRADSLLKECLIRNDPVLGKQTDIDFGLGIVKAGAEQSLAVILDLHKIAIGSRAGQAEHFVIINPGMPRHDAVGFTGSKENGGECINDCRHIPSFASRPVAGKQIHFNEDDNLLVLFGEPSDNSFKLMKTTFPVSSLLHQKNVTLWSVTPETTVFDAIRLMAEKNIGALPVLSEGRLLGIFTERDYTRKIALQGKSSRATQVSAVVTEKVLTVAPGDSVEECMRLMTENRVRHLPVVADGRVAGIISIGDLVNWIISAQNAEIEQLEQYIAGGAPA